jgi:hypothetical protein
MGVIAEAEGKPIVIRVTAEDELTIKYYGVTLAEAGPPVLTSLSLGGSTWPAVPGTPVADLGTPNATLAGISAGSVTLSAAIAAGTVPFGGTTPTVLATVAANSGTAYRISQTTGANPVEGDWKGITQGQYGPESPAFNPINDNDALWIELTRAGTTFYYKIAVTVTP